MDKPAIYIETSVVSYLVARPSRDLIVAAHQQLTSDWWYGHSENYNLFISQIVLDEARAGDAETAAKRMTALGQIPLLEISDDVIQLAENLVESHAVPKKAAQDALHIAVACVHGTDYL